MCTASSGTASSYPMVWVRAVTSRGHHFVTCISKDGGGTEYGAAVKGRATISRDNGQSTVRLQLNNLRAEDTGTYYCAKGASSCGGCGGAHGIDVAPGVNGGLRDPSPGDITWALISPSGLRVTPLNPGATSIR